MSENQEQNYEGEQMTLFVTRQPNVSASSAASYALRYGSISRDSDSDNPSLDNYSRYVSALHELQSHAKELQELKKQSVVDDDTIKEVLLQHFLMITRRSELSQHKGKTALMCGGELIIADSLDDAVKNARTKYGKRPYYAEAIDLIAFTGLFPPDADKFLH